RDHPKLVVSNMRRSRRVGRVLVDWSQNEVHKTTICAYSLRARARPTVSTPVSWGEVEAMVAAADPALLEFEVEQVIERADRLVVADLEQARPAGTQTLERSVLLARDVMDALVLDLAQRQASRANDLWLEQADGQLILRAADLSPWAVLRRLGRGAFGRGA